MVMEMRRWPEQIGDGFCFGGEGFNLDIWEIEEKKNY